MVLEPQHFTNYPLTGHFKVKQEVKTLLAVKM